MKNIVRAVKATVLLMTMALLTAVGAANANNVAVCLDAAEKEQWSKAMPACIKAAEQGDKVAQTMLGLMYGVGQGVAQDYVQAVRWYRLAAAQGEATAQFNLGLMYSKGQGVVQDSAQAVRWLTLAAGQGLAEAQTNLGWMHQEGRGVAKNHKEAVRWYRLAAAQGNADAQYNLGLMYGVGQGVAQDYVRAHMWFNLAAASGLAESVKGRDIAASQMTREQIAEAQRMARDCAAKNYKGC